jgi:predicted nucleotidyltransferase
MDELLRNQILTAIAGWPSLTLVVVYGSAATGRMRDDSDVDLAVLGRTPLNVDARLSIASAIAGATGRKVDLLDLGRAHGTILSEVLTSGVRLIVNDRAALEMLMRRLVYEEADYMPLYRRMLKERRERMFNG